MRCKKFLICALALALAIEAGPAEAASPPRERVDQIRTFASCAGRMTALRDHLALFGGESVDRADRLRASHLAVLEALVAGLGGSGPGLGRIMAWRVEALAAQRAVLLQARFGTTPEARLRAGSASERQIGLCNRLILGA